MLGVPSSATEKELSRAYKKLAKQHHPDATPGTRRPRSASRRSTPPTTCSATPRSAPSTTRCARWSRRASVPTVPGGFGGPAAASAAAVSTFTFDSSTDGGRPSPTCFGNLLGGRGARAAARARRDRAATRPGPRDRAAPLVRRRGARRHDTVRFRADATCSTCNGSGAAPGTMPGDVPGVSRQRVDRRQPGPVLVLAGVPHVRRARPGHPDPVPDVSAAAASRCARAR